MKAIEKIGWFLSGAAVWILAGLTNAEEVEQHPIGIRSDVLLCFTVRDGEFYGTAKLGSIDNPEGRIEVPYKGGPGLSGPPSFTDKLTSQENDIALLSEAIAKLLDRLTILERKISPKKDLQSDQR